MAKKYKSLATLAATFSPSTPGPFDNRSVVTSYTDLNKKDFWGGYAYLGMTVAVYDDLDSTKNGLYRLDSDPTNTTGNWVWTKLLTSSDITPYDDSDVVKKVKVGNQEYTPSSNTVNLPAYPTSLPASDVKDWAKADTKPTYQYSEILNRPNIPSAPGTLNTNNASAQSVSASESLSGNIKLHKISKTGKYTDLIDRPTIPAAANKGEFTIKSGDMEVQTFNADSSDNKSITFIAGDNITLTPSTIDKSITIEAANYDDTNVVKTDGLGSTNEAIVVKDTADKKVKSSGKIIKTAAPSSTSDDSTIPTSLAVHKAIGGDYTGYISGGKSGKTYWSKIASFEEMISVAENGSNNIRAEFLLSKYLYLDPTPETGILSILIRRSNSQTQEYSIRCKGILSNCQSKYFKDNIQIKYGTDEAKLYLWVNVFAAASGGNNGVISLKLLNSSSWGSSNADKWTFYTKTDVLIDDDDYNSGNLLNIEIADLNVTKINNVAVGDTPQFTDTTYSAATSVELGLVKSTSTGTTADRNYNVEVNSDGTMKVNVPWTNTDRYVNSASFDQDSTKNNVKMTLTRAGSDSAAVVANIPAISAGNAGVVKANATVSSQTQSTKFLREDGTWAAPSYTTNTDTKVTSVSNHYSPTADNNVELTARISETAGTYAQDTEYTVLTGVKAQRDAKGHITGLTYTAQNVKDTNTTYSSKTAANGGTEVSLVTTGEKYTWNNKQGALTAGTNISIDNNAISAVGYTYDTNKNSFAEGLYTSARANCSHAGGIGTIANEEAMTAIGLYNNTTVGNIGGTYLFSVGNGTESRDRKNVFSVTTNGATATTLNLSGGNYLNLTYGGKLSFGDGNSCYITEIYDSDLDRNDILTIYGELGINLHTDTSEQITTNCSISVQGKVNATDGFFQTSDIRKKNIISDLSLDKAYDLIDKCQTIIYTLKDDKSNKEQIGLIAQEVKEFFPEIISENKTGELSLDYSRLTVVILKVLKDLILRISNVEKTINNKE